MKKLLIIALAFTTFFANAGEPEISMYIKPSKKQTNESKFLNGNNAGGWAMVGGASLFAGSMIKLFTSTLEAPDAGDFESYDKYKQSLDKYNNNVKNTNMVFYGTLGLSGFCFLVSGLELANRPVVTTEKVSLKIKSTPSTVGLCLNFK